MPQSFSIDSFPKKLRPYLEISDAAGNNNKGIDSYEEALNAYTLCVTACDQNTLLKTKLEFYDYKGIKNKFYESNTKTTEILAKAFDNSENKEKIIDIFLRIKNEDSSFELGKIICNKKLTDKNVRNKLIKHFNLEELSPDIKESFKHGKFGIVIDRMLKDYKRPPHQHVYIESDGRPYILYGCKILGKGLFPYLIEAVVRSNKQISGQAKSLLDAAKFDIEDKLRNYVNTHDDTKQTLYAKSLIKKIETQRAKKPVLVEGVVEGSYSFAHDSKNPNDISYFLTLRVLKVPDGTKYSKLIITDHLGKEYAQSCNAYGNKFCTLPTQTNLFWIYIRKGNHKLKARLDHYKEVKDRETQENKFVYIESSNTFFIKI